MTLSPSMGTKPTRRPKIKPNVNPTSVANATAERKTNALFN
jgi:hypothetical protein